MSQKQLWDSTHEQAGSLWSMINPSTQAYLSPAPADTLNLRYFSTWQDLYEHSEYWWKYERVFNDKPGRLISESKFKENPNTRMCQPTGYSVPMLDTHLTQQLRGTALFQPS